MTPKVLVHFDSGNVQGGAAAILSAAKISLDTVDIDEITMPPRQTHHEFVYLTLAEDDERLPRLLELLQQHGLTWTENHFDAYTDEELDNARLLLLRPTSQCEVDGGSEFGTTYDLTGTCPGCGVGARQTSVFFLDGAEDELPKLKGHRAAATYRDEMLIDDQIAAELEALAPTGLILHQVYALMPETQEQVKLAYKQLSADLVLPPMSPPTDLSRAMPGVCRLCTRSGYMMGPCRYVFYRRKDLEAAGDVNLSWEGQYGGQVNEDPRKCVIPVPVILVTPKVMRVFRAAGITEFEWVPIRVVDE